MAVAPLRRSLRAGSHRLFGTFLFAAVASSTFSSSPLSPSPTKPNVLVVFNRDSHGQLDSLAEALTAGARSVTPNVQAYDVSDANYKRDVVDWPADAVLLGSAVYNGNADPLMLAFINSFDFEDDHTSQVAGAFATGGGAAAGLQPVLEELTRGLQTFGFITVGGADWRSGEGTGVVTNGTDVVANGSEAWTIGYGHGARIAKVAAKLKAVEPTPSPTPPPEDTVPPAWGELFTATVSANITQVGYDAGLVIVNFTQLCNGDPSTQQMRTVYGDFYTVLTRCDLGREFTIAPASRGGGCEARLIGRDVDARICRACGCPFCVRDTKGVFTAGDGKTKTVTVWSKAVSRVIDGRDVLVYEGRAQGEEQFDLETSLAYDAADRTTPLYVNISHPLWLSSTARIDHFTRDIDGSAFAIPSNCPQGPGHSADVLGVSPRAPGAAKAEWLISRRHEGKPMTSLLI